VWNGLKRVIFEASHPSNPQAGFHPTPNLKHTRQIPETDEGAQEPPFPEKVPLCEVIPSKQDIAFESALASAALKPKEHAAPLPLSDTSLREKYSPRLIRTLDLIIDEFHANSEAVRSLAREILFSPNDYKAVAKKFLISEGAAMAFLQFATDRMDTSAYEEFKDIKYPGIKDARRKPDSAPAPILPSTQASNSPVQVSRPKGHGREFPYRSPGAQKPIAH